MDLSERRKAARWLLLTALTLPAMAAAEENKAATGSICIAPFKADDYSIGPPMLMEFSAPSSKTTYSFRIDKKFRATVGVGEMAHIEGLPLDRKVLVEVRMNDKPMEAFRLDLRNQWSDNRVCLWLYPGYWHWIDNGWDPKLGCRCEAGNSGSGKVSKDRTEKKRAPAGVGGRGVDETTPARGTTNLRVTYASGPLRPRPRWVR